MTYVFINAIGFSELNARILAAAGSMDYLFFSFMAYFVVERFGRRKVMMTSAAACSICWTIIAISMGLSETGRADPYRMGAVAVSFFFVFFASFAMGVLGIPWLYPTEVNALAFRAKGAALAMATNWINKVSATLQRCTRLAGGVPEPLSQRVCVALLSLSAHEYVLTYEQ